MNVHRSRRELRPPERGRERHRESQQDEDCKPAREPLGNDAVNLVCHGLQSLLARSRHRIQAAQPQSHSLIHAFAVVCSTEIQHEPPQSSEYDGSDSARLLALIRFTTELVGHKLQPILNGVAQEFFVKLRVTQRYAVSFKEKTKERFGIRRTHALPNGLAALRKAGPLYPAIGGALPLPDLRQNFDNHFFLRSEVVKQNTRSASECFG